MAKQLDISVLTGFIEEVKAYLPEIWQGIQSYQADPTRLDGLEIAHRHTHTIKGASSMVGLSSLSHIADYLEKTFEEIGAGQLALNDEMATWLRQTLDQIEGYLEGILTGSAHDDEALLAEVILSYRRLRGLPIDESEAAVTDEPSPDFATMEESLMDAEPLQEEIPSELLEAFQLEAEDHLHNISLSLAGLQKEPENKELLQNVRRSAHTLKGAAGIVGLSTVAKLSHRMEDLLDKLYDDSIPLNSDIINLLYDSSDALEDLMDETGDTEEIATTLHTLYVAYEALLGPEIGQKPDLGTKPLVEEKVLDLSELALQVQKTSDETPSTLASPKRGEVEQRDPSEVVRVSIERLDELIRLVGELVITRTAFEQRMGDLTREVEELQPSIERLRRASSRLEIEYEVSTLGGGLHRILASQKPASKQNGDPAPMYNPVSWATQADDFDELEFDRYTEFHLLSRELAETTNDVNAVGNTLNTLIGDFDNILNRQSRLSSELQEKLMRTRMVPLASLATRLHRAVRVVARQQDKQVELILDGERIELDKTVLEDMADPLLHLLRNAIDHGIEAPSLREALGKPQQGQIRLAAYHEGNQVVIQISDDGAGLNSKILRAKAVSGGYISEAEASNLSDEAMHALVFLPGFSTANQISDVSGRGVGLDVVKTNVNKLKGTIKLDSTPGQGTAFTIRLPRTLAVTRALLVKANNETFAIPLSAIAQLLRLEREDFDQVGQESVIRMGGQVYPLLRLGEVLNLRQPVDDTAQRPPVLILDAGGQQVALIVDHILQGREIVIKTLGNHLQHVHGIMGATLMGDGSVILILNPTELVTDPTQKEVLNPFSTQPPTPTVRQTWSILVVDDSVSVRRVVSNMIKNAGWQPTTARDGLEALEIIQRSAQPPDLILLDIEMPRMDGYELTATLRAQEAYQDIPIVMLTSRAGEKHRRKAFDLGASEYVVKPYQDEILLNLVRRLVQESTRPHPG